MIKHKIFQENPDSVISTEFGDFRAPFHCYAAQSYTMMGTVSLDGARDRLSQEGLYPFQFRMPNGDVGAGAQVSFIDYSDTNYGPYRELVFSLFTTVSEAPTDYENETSLLCLGESPERIVFTIDLHLDSESGLVAGRDVGGMPKNRADLNYDFENKCFVVSNENGVVASLDAGDDYWLTDNVVRQQLLAAFGSGRIETLSKSDVESYRVATPIEPLRQWMELQQVAPARLAVPNDSLAWSYSPAEELDFAPMLISYMPSIQYVMLLSTAPDSD